MNTKHDLKTQEKGQARRDNQDCPNFFSVQVGTTSALQTHAQHFGSLSPPEVANRSRVGPVLVGAGGPGRGPADSSESKSWSSEPLFESGNGTSLISSAIPEKPLCNSTVL